MAMYHRLFRKIIAVRVLPMIHEFPKSLAIQDEGGDSIEREDRQSTKKSRNSRKSPRSNKV